MPMSSPRTVRSHASSAASRPEAKPRASRPELRVITGQRAESVHAADAIARVIEWTRTRSAPLLHVAIAVTFLLCTLIGSLMLRTQMVENSFEASEIEQHISQLTQDVEDDQAKLDQLVASLPSKAEEMGMVPQSGSISIDLNGYQSSESESAAQ
ncbi:hypothetical protein BLEM_0215 [Bifidobacterium lemurum]|uniref:Cell division protein FtsL n=2 Tax=Bifidobacterium lemurum TaxID=1603886 RepID=A0A261FWJ1_9BIFI|nr:hypothetical protein BLEM_0215 [Bifidobacterium lemurum]